MITPKSVALEGVGYGFKAIATQGWLVSITEIIEDVFFNFKKVITNYTFYNFDKSILFYEFVEHLFYEYGISDFYQAHVNFWMGENESL